MLCLAQMQLYSTYIVQHRFTEYNSVLKLKTSEEARDVLSILFG